MVMNIDGVELAFAKANHLKYCYDSAKEYKVFSFNSVKDGCFTKFTKNSAVESGYGILHVKHCCLYCIKAGNSPNLAKSVGYSLHTLIEEKNVSHCRIMHVCTYKLSQCYKVSPTSLSISL